VHRIDAIDSRNLDTIKEWLNSVNIKYYESKMNLNWKPILKTILDDPQKFVEEGGWDFLDLDKSDEEDEEEEESDGARARAAPRCSVLRCAHGLLTRSRSPRRLCAHRGRRQRRRGRRGVCGGGARHMPCRCTLRNYAAAAPCARSHPPALCLCLVRCVFATSQGSSEEESVAESDEEDDDDSAYDDEDEEEEGKDWDVRAHTHSSPDTARVCAREC
jgi:uncharacterized Fe-S radical SAM superfamily protein PflX